VAKYLRALIAPVLLASLQVSALPTDEGDIESEIEEEKISEPVKPEPPKPQSETATAPVKILPETGEQATAPTPAPAPAITTSSGNMKSEPIFDWSKHQGQRQVPHPFAEKGLVRITKRNEYIYRVDESDQKRAASFRLGIFKPTNLENPEQAGQDGSTFDDNYDQTGNPMVMFDYEWQLWKTPIGKLGVKAGIGLYVAQGHGHFRAGPNSGLVPREMFTFLTFPTTGGVVYRLQWRDRQTFVPYGEGGGVLFPFGEFRDDDKPPKFGGSVGAYFAGGLAINLTSFDALSRVQLDREYGINSVYLLAEFRAIVAITQRYDFSSTLINGGFLMEF